MPRKNPEQFQGIEEMVRHRTKELDKVNRKLKRVLELKSIFMGDVSHEFRTSLTIMQCSLEIISRNSEIKKENRQLFDNVITEIRRLSNTLTDLMQLTRSDFAQPRTHHRMIDLGRIIPAICREMKVLTDGKGIMLAYEDPGSPVEILADKDEIEKLLLNLMRNAIKYNVQNGWVAVRLEKKKNGVCLHVEDGGVGIPKKELPHIFERFYRVDRVRIGKDMSSGLGLAICKHIAEMHGGRISVKSTVGAGSVFTVYFPNPTKKSS